MLISELLEELGEIQGTYGDLKVFVVDNDRQEQPLAQVNVGMDSVTRQLCVTLEQ